MAMEKRSNGRVYFFSYGGKRATGTSIKLFLGTGAMGESLALIAAEHREERRRRVAEEQQERQQLLAAARLSCRAIEATKQVFATKLSAIGYHQHARGVWRKTRTGGVSNMARTPSDQGDQQTLRPSATRIPRRKHRDYAASRQAPALADAAMKAWFGFLSEADPSAAAMLRGQLEEIRDRLLNLGDSELERICSARIILGVLEVQAMNLRALMHTEMSEHHAAFLRERQRVAEKRLATAMRALHTARRVFRRELERNSRSKQSAGLTAKKMAKHS
jgi:hypothetical protein